MKRSLVLLVTVALLTACQHASRCCNPGASLQHVVLFTLHDPAQAGRLIQDCEMLLEIPGVTCVAAGPHVDVGRPTVISDYHVGLVVCIESVAAYRGYLEHPVHDKLLDQWRPRIATLRVIDFGRPRDADGS